MDRSVGGWILRDEFMYLVDKVTVCLGARGEMCEKRCMFVLVDEGVGGRGVKHAWGVVLFAPKARGCIGWGVTRLTDTRD